MERSFRLEFNEEKQHFHYDNYTHPENTNGYKTICESMTDDEIKIFRCYIDDVYHNSVRKYTVNELKEAVSKLQKFTINLLEFNLTIKK